MTCTPTNTQCQACVDNTNTKTFAALSPEAKAIFRMNYEDPVSHNSVLGTTPLHAAPCNEASSKNACTASQPKPTWRAYLIYGIFGITIVASIVGVVMALKLKSSAAQKFSKLKNGTHPTTGKALDPAQEGDMRQTRHELYKMTGAHQ